MTAAHFATGLAAARLAQNDWRWCLPAAIVGHVLCDVSGAYHPDNLFTIDTRGKQVLGGCIAVTAGAALGGLRADPHGWLVSCAWGLLAWLWADSFWALRAIWPAADKFNPHRLWWRHGWEHRLEPWGLWLECGLTAAALIVAVTA